MAIKRELHDQVPFQYEGFSSPNGTVVPDDVFDVLMPRLTDPELRVLLYIIRRTFGFKKDSDSISLKQMVEGIRTRDGRVLDSGTGMSKASVARGIKGLNAKGIILATHNSSRERGDEPTTYALRFRNGPVSQAETRGVSQTKTGGSLTLRQARVSPVDPQQTVEQQTDRSLSNIRKADSPKAGLSGSAEHHKQDPQALGELLRKPDHTRIELGESYDEDRQVLVDYLADFAREFGDRSSLKSTTTRVYRLYQQAGIERSTFIERMYQARAITKERGGSIRSARFAYFLSVLEDVLGLRRDEGDVPHQ